MVMVIWAAAAEVITTDGAEDAVIITAGTAVDIAITTEIRNRRPRLSASRTTLQGSTILRSDPALKMNRANNGERDARAARIYGRNRRNLGWISDRIALAC
jgi:hypothetical protein